MYITRSILFIDRYGMARDNTVKSRGLTLSRHLIDGELHFFPVYVWTLGQTKVYAVFDI